MLILLALLAAGEIPVTSANPEAVAAFRRGQELHDSSQFVPAAKEFAKALQLDSGYQQARSYLGLDTPGAAGLKLAEDAVAGAAKLPEAERLLIEANAARKR